MNSKSLVIASGKGGVGKTTLTAALGVALSKKHLRVCAMDADIGLRDLDMQLQMENIVVYDLLDVVNKDCKLKNAEVIHPNYHQLSLVAASQTASTKDFSSNDMQRIVNKLKKRFQYVLIDAPAGIEKGYLNLIQATDENILITTPDDIAIRNAERLVQVLLSQKKERPKLVVNRVVPKLVQNGQMYKPQTVADILDVPLLGYIPEDEQVRTCILKHKQLMETEGEASMAITRIASRLDGESVAMPSLEKKWFFWWR